MRSPQPLVLGQLLVVAGSVAVHIVSAWPVEPSLAVHVWVYKGVDSGLPQQSVTDSTQVYVTGGAARTEEAAAVSMCVFVWRNLSTRAGWHHTYAYLSWGWW